MDIPTWALWVINAILTIMAIYFAAAWAKFKEKIKAIANFFDTISQVLADGNITPEEAAAVISKFFEILEFQPQEAEKHD